MADEMTPEQIAEMQKKNCIFCRIISGEMESKKVFENDHFLAILDIRPAAPGHVLFMPKEHVPILPILSEERMEEFFSLGTQVAGSVQDAMISQRVTLFIASGYAAGQQAPHLILHIIPREKGDGLDMLDVAERNVAQADAIAIGSIFNQATMQALQHKGRDDLTKQHHIHKKQPQVETSVMTDTPGGPALVKAEGNTSAPRTRTLPNTPDDTAAKTVVEPTVRDVKEFETTNEALQAALEMSPDLRRLIIAQPDMVEDYVKKSPKLAKLFDRVNIRALSLALRKHDESKETGLKSASQMDENELFAFIDGNEGLRTWILENPDELIAHLDQNPKLQRFFAGVDLHSIARKYRAYRDARGGL
jgi:histidine triad (HIT) family protein